MKKSFRWGLAALPLLTMLATSCNQERVESRKDRDSQITFKAAIGKQTLSKASEWTNSSWVPNTSALSVWAYSSLGQFNEPGSPGASFVIGYDGVDWNYAGTPVTQPGYPIAYYSYYPETNISGLITPTVSGASFAYTVQGIGTQEDLIAACVPSTLNTVIALNFDHVLSQVNFAVQGIEGMYITLSNMSVNGVKNGGTYTFVSGWGTTPAGSANYAYVTHSTAATTFPATDGTNGILYLGNKGGATQTDNNNDNALMLMPQTFPTAGTGGNFTFDYLITDMAATPLTLKSGSATAYFSDFTTNEWELGKRYLYLIDFSNLFVGGPITFTVNVSPWTDASNLDVAQPLLVAETSKAAIEQAISQHNDLKAATPALTIFPISLPTAPAGGAAIELLDFSYNEFEEGDEIRIHCVTNAGAQEITLDASLGSDWTRSVSGNIVTLTRLP